VYSNFESKDALFAAVIERYHDRQVAEIVDRVDWSAPASEQAAWAGQEFMSIRDSDLFLLMLEYTLYAARFPAGHEAMRAGHRRFKEAVAATMERMAPDLDWDIRATLPVVEMVTAFFALSDGIALQRLYDPDTCPDDLYPKVLTILVRGLIATASDQNAASPS
jgi:AcrR family transcriptional regulator